MRICSWNYEMAFFLGWSFILSRISMGVVAKWYAKSPPFLYFHPHWLLSTTFTCILLKSHTTFRIFFDGNNFVSVNLFPGGKNIGCRSIQVCHQVNYVFVVKFKPVFTVIVRLFNTLKPQRQTLKKPCR